jgi:predicted RNA-binding Zn-ribbon protein involved in translation (DUF1610 family)
MSKQQAIFLKGNISEGFTAYGPYESICEALEEHDGEDGWGMSLENKDPSKDSCPNCGSLIMVQVGQDVNLYQCDVCGHECPREELV